MAKIECKISEKRNNNERATNLCSYEEKEGKNALHFCKKENWGRFFVRLLIAIQQHCLLFMSAFHKHYYYCDCNQFLSECHLA